MAYLGKTCHLIRNLKITVRITILNLHSYILSLRGRQLGLFIFFFYFTLLKLDGLLHMFGFESWFAFIAEVKVVFIDHFSLL